MYQWIQTIAGTGVLTIEGEDVAVPLGYGMLLYPGVAHAYKALESPWYVHWFTFNGHHIESMLQYIGLRRSGVFAVSDPLVLEGHIRKGLHILSGKNEMTGLDGSVMAYQFLIDLFKYVKTNHHTSHDINLKRIKEVFSYIGDHNSTHIGIEELADVAGVTPQYFCEIFKEVMQQRPTEYFNQRRIDRAKELMVKFPFKKISEIAREVGFESNGYFATVFKKQEGLSPNKYRELL